MSDLFIGKTNPTIFSVEKLVQVRSEISY